MGRTVLVTGNKQRGTPIRSAGDRREVPLLAAEGQVAVVVTAAGSHRAG